MKVELTEWQIILIAETLPLARGAVNWDCQALRDLRVTSERFKRLAYNTRAERAKRRRYARAVRIVTP